MANPENKQIPYESTQKDIRDAIESVATAIGGIAIPSADHVSYDNSGSGLSATDVQNALDEIVSDIPTVNDGTLTIQQNGETKGTFTANQSGNSTVNIEIPTTDIQTAVDEFSTFNGGLLSECKVALSPIQDLSHGDPSPDNICPISGHTQVEVGDDGKNLFNPTDIISGMRLTNITGTAYNSTQDVIAESNSFVSSLIKVTQGNIVTKNSPNEDAYHRWHIYDGNGICVRYTSDNVITIGSGESYVALCGANSEINTTLIRQGYQVTVNLGGTYYSGTLDVVSGVLTVDTARLAINTSTIASISKSGLTSADIFTLALPSTYKLSANAILSHYPYINTENVNEVGKAWLGTSNTQLRIGFSAYGTTTLEDFKTWLDANNVEGCFELATPTPIQLSPTMVKALVGENHLSAPLDGQEITESKYRELFTWDEVESYVNAHSGGGSGMNYSTEEQVVGTWIDGKPLYQKSISINGVSIPANQTVTIYTQANISMKYFSGYLTENSTTYVIPEIGVRIKQSGDNIQISSQSGASWTISEGYVTIRYTKTTD